MTFGTNDHRRLPPTRLQRACGGTMLVSVVALCAWTLGSTLADTGANQIDLVTRGDKLDGAASRGDKLVAPSAPASNVHISLFDPRSSLNFSPGTFAGRTPVQGDSNPLGPMPSLAAGRTTSDSPPPASLR